jgi:hypothetical protein
MSAEKQKRGIYVAAPPPNILKKFFTDLFSRAREAQDGFRTL